MPVVWCATYCKHSAAAAAAAVGVGVDVAGVVVVFTPELVVTQQIAARVSVRRSVKVGGRSCNH